MDAELELPNGIVKAKIIGQRYEPFGEHLSIDKYSIGASIEEMSSSDRDVYEEYLRKGGRLAKNKSSILELGVNKS